MKYRAGNIVLLNNEKTVYIMSVNEKTKKYQVFEVGNEDKVYSISETSIFSLLT